jgi:hypothetical protein
MTSRGKSGKQTTCPSAEAFMPPEDRSSSNISWRGHFPYLSIRRDDPPNRSSSMQITVHAASQNSSR